MFALSPVAASPAFTRQTGAACTRCHYQDMRSLNAYGRDFLLNSFHESQKMIESRRLQGRAANKDDGRPLEEPKAHIEDQAEFEDRQGVEISGPLEHGRLEPQEKSEEK
ncbi:MAG: hypothetical protein Q9M30_02320 [Mariprofundaceae bacterium]|nr:hypothetical protein [Mariprofundaceae bacterium]